MANQFIGLLGDCRALVEPGIDSLGQHTRAPTFHPAHLGVEVALKGLVEVQQRTKVGPTQLSTQCVDNVFIGKNLGKPHHVAQVLRAKAAPVVNGQLLRQRCHDLLTVRRALALQHLGVDTLPHAPVEQREPHVDGDGGLLPSGIDEMAQLGQQRIGRCAGHHLLLRHAAPIG